MTSGSLQNSSTKLAHPIQFRFYLSFWLKLKGLMFSRQIGEYEGVMFVEERPSRLNTAIHMFFMNYDIAVIWMDKQKKVVDKALAKKWAPAYVPAQPACYVLETHANRLSDFTIGDTIHW
jgi:uncharacterized membrane protein (UPF0127 family)